MSTISDLGKIIFGKEAKAQPLAWADVLSVSGGKATVSLGPGCDVECPSICDCEPGDRVLVLVSGGKSVVMGVVRR